MDDSFTSSPSGPVSKSGELIIPKNKIKINSTTDEGAAQRKKREHTEREGVPFPLLLLVAEQPSTKAMASIKIELIYFAAVPNYLPRSR